MKSNSRKNAAGSTKTSLTLQGESLSLSELNSELRKSRLSPRAKRRRIQKKEPYSPEVFVGERSEFV
jgi:hypothetical protein